MHEKESRILWKSEKEAVTNADRPTHPSSGFPRGVLTEWIFCQDVPPLGMRFPFGGHPGGADLVPPNRRPLSAIPILTKSDVNGKNNPTIRKLSLQQDAFIDF